MASNSSSEELLWSDILFTNYREKRGKHCGYREAIEVTLEMGSGKISEHSWWKSSELDRHFVGLSVVDVLNKKWSRFDYQPINKPTKINFTLSFVLAIFAGNIRRRRL